MFHHLQDMKRTALQNKRIGDLRMAIRARKVLGTFEKWAPEEDNLISIPCSFDMGWQKRGKGHNSHTSHVAVMRLTTGKVFDCTT